MIVLVLVQLLLAVTCALTVQPPTKVVVLDFAGTLQGAGCSCSGGSDVCSTCNCSDYGCCTPPDCASPQCGGGTPCDCTRCSSGGPNNHTCVTTATMRQCYFAQSSSVLSPFQVLVKITAVFWDTNAYSWLSYAANSQRVSFQPVSAVDNLNLYAGQNPVVLPKLPGFGGTAGSPQRMFYNTNVFGPLDWAVLGPRFNAAAGVNVRICDSTGVCTTSPCTFGPDKPVLTPGQVGQK